MASGPAIDRERERVREIGDDLSGWRRWGPYVSDRSWGTVREDYSHDGNAWGYLTYDKARAKAYRWGEDGIAGLCDRYQLLCFAPAFWNERDPGGGATPRHIPPSLWFRATWGWGAGARRARKITCESAGGMCLVTDDSGTPVDPNMPAHYRLGPRYLYGPAAPALFTDNETNGERAYGPGNTSRKLHTKDAFHRAICERDPTTVRP